VTASGICPAHQSSPKSSASSTGCPLRTFAESMRDVRMARAAESAEKVGVKMLFPMIAFILPAILIVMGGGAMIKIWMMFNSLH